MNTKYLFNPAAAVAVAACLGIFPTESDAVDVMRWAVEVKGLEATSWNVFNPNPVSSVVDAHGYFDAQDVDGDGKIVQVEVLAIEPMVGLIYASPADALLYFAYDPAVGLSYQIDGYHYTIDFGHQAARFSDTGGTTYRWTASTVTTIGPPVPVPEPPRQVMLIGGLAMMGLLAWRNHRQRGSALDAAR